ncbi:hypothetical protein B0H19DRAFT_1184027, partial [Mycena capillaripes]
MNLGQLRSACLRSRGFRLHLRRPVHRFWDHWRQPWRPRIRPQCGQRRGVHQEIRRRWRNVFILNNAVDFRKVCERILLRLQVSLGKMRERTDIAPVAGINTFPFLPGSTFATGSERIERDEILIFDLLHPR